MTVVRRLAPARQSGGSGRRQWQKCSVHRLRSAFAIGAAIVLFLLFEKEFPGQEKHGGKKDSERDDLLYHFRN